MPSVKSPYKDVGLLSPFFDARPKRKAQTPRRSASPTNRGVKFGHDFRDRSTIVYRRGKTGNAVTHDDPRTEICERCLHPKFTVEGKKCVPSKNKALTKPSHPR